jgi:DNA-directed RNA polymerase subunit E'/Rpb7
MPVGKSMRNEKQVDKQVHKTNPLYIKNLLEIKIALLPMEIGENQTKTNLQHIIKSKLEGKCIREGYVKPGTINVRNYSSGLVKGERIEFTVIFECYTCSPAEGTVLSECVIKSVTKAGIHCNVLDEMNNVPVTVFIARDHSISDVAFQKITENELGKKVDVKVIGTRFELNDECVEVLGVLYHNRS